MKETPLEHRIQERLKPGVLTLDGFLGNDKRHYHDIIAEDLERLKALHKNKEEVAERMQHLTDRAFEYADDEAIIDEKFRIAYQTERGKLVSPFLDKGLIPKGVIQLTNVENNISIQWTPLNIDMIRKYGFFEGKGAKHRLEPEVLIAAIF